MSVIFQERTIITHQAVTHGQTKDIRRGQVYLADLGNNPEGIQRGVRPIAIVSNNINNRFSPIVNIVPISTAVKKRYPQHVYLEASRCGLERDSFALIEQTTTFLKKDLEQYLCTLDDEIMCEIDQRICLQMTGIDYSFYESFLKILNNSDQSPIVI